MKRIIIGVDISKKKFDIAYLATSQKWQRRNFDNRLQGFEYFLKCLKEEKFQHFHVVMEATGRYGESLAYFLYEKGCDVSIVNPAQIKYYSRSLLRRTKTDKIDSQLITEFALRHNLPLWQPLSPTLQALKEQVRCLGALKKDVTQISNRLEHAQDVTVKKTLKEHLVFIQKQIKGLTLTITKLVQDDPKLTGHINLLKSIPGIGTITAISLLAELPDLSTFKCAKQLAAFAGLNPSIKTSGTTVKGKQSISKMGRNSLRRILFFPAMTLLRCGSPLKPFVENLRTKGKIGKVIVAAVMRKLLHIIFGVLKGQSHFQEELCSKTL